MSLSNREIADIFERCADMLQIRGDNIHRVLSYRRAAESIRVVPRDLRAISSEGGLTKLSSIGKTISAKIAEMLGYRSARILRASQSRGARRLGQYHAYKRCWTEKSETLLGTA